MYRWSLGDIFTDWKLPQQFGLLSAALRNVIRVNMCTHTQTYTPCGNMQAGFIFWPAFFLWSGCLFISDNCTSCHALWCACCARTHVCVHACSEECVCFFIVTDIKLSFLFPQNELYRLLTVRASELQNTDLPFLKGRSLIPAGRLGLKACLEVWRPIQTIQ